MTINRDWITVAEHAKSKGVTREAIYNQISRGTFQLPYVQMEGLKGTILIHNPDAAVNVPQKTKAQKQVNFPQTACNRAGTK